MIPCRSSRSAGGVSGSSSDPSYGATTQATAISAPMPSTSRASAANVRVGAAPLDQRVERALLALEVAAVQPHALAAVGVDEDGVLHVERRPDPLPGDEQHLVVDVAVRALGEQRLPEERGCRACRR